MSKYLYIQENKDWNIHNKFKYGFTSNPLNRIISEQHSHKSSYISLYKCEETSNYLYDYKEYDKIISRLRSKSFNDIKQQELEFNIDLRKFKEIKEYLIDDGGGTEFIRTNEGIELLDYIFMNVFKDIGINVIKLSKTEIDKINNNNENDKQKTETSLKSLQSSKIILQDYQIDIIDIGIKKLLEINKFYLELATGAGKSTIIYYILNNLILKNIDIPYTIIILTPRINISSQNINDKYIKILKKKINIYDNDKIKRIRTFSNTSYNLISCCIQSFQYLYEKIIIKFNISNIIIWFDESHYFIDNWIKLDNDIKSFFLTDNKIINYRIFTSASPDRSIIINNKLIFGDLCSPITVRTLIKNKWLTPIKPHIMDFNDNDNDNNNDNDNDKYYYYTNTILNIFQEWNKRIGLNFHNTSNNAIFAFKSHYKKFINSKTNIKPYLLISDEIKNKKILDLLDNNYKHLLNFEDFHNEDNNAIAYIVNMYNMGYDNSKIDFLVFADPKLSNKDIIQSIGRGIRPDSLGLNGKNLNKINDIIIPIYNKEDDTEDRYLKFNKIKEILQYLIYDVGIDIKDIQIHKNLKLNKKGDYLLIDDKEKLDECQIIANIINWNIEPKIETWNIKKISNHLKNNNIHNYKNYNEYISLDENKNLNLPLELFKQYPNFDFTDTYDNNENPYYNRKDCISAIERYRYDFIENEEINKEDYNEIIEFLNNIDPKIPNYLLWNYYGGFINDFLLFT
jgi:superfamily II DNA or RNA helicase